MIYKKMLSGSIGVNVNHAFESVLIAVQTGEDDESFENFVQTRVILTVKQTEQLILDLQRQLERIK
jgi:hypothetical protein